ncbi:MAG: response regulator [Candidatus Binataceae bacterium]|nr:response regulator [Candidatus Binataceae bacterium]
MAVPVIATVAVVAVLAWQFSVTTGDVASIENIDQVISEARRAQTYLARAESDQRAFLLTGLDRDLGASHRSFDLTIDTINTLHRLVLDNPSQVQALLSINDNIAEWKLYTDTELHLRTGPDPAIKEHLLGIQSTLMDTIDAQFENFMTVQRQMREQRSSEERDAHNFLLVFAALIGPIAGGFLGLMGWKQIQRLSRTYEASLAVADSARVRAEAANHAKDQFLGVVSHELRAPLSTILTWSHLLRSNDIEAGQMARAIDAIERGARNQAQLIDDILDVSRIVAGKFRLDIKPTQLTEVIDNAIESVRSAADAKRVDLTVDVEPLIEPILCDPARLQQVVWNLLSNAIKFSDSGDSVRIRLRRIDDLIELNVTDDGQGIDPVMLPHLFERFWQADSSTTRSAGGLGLGLSIVRHIVELHGGSVTAHSRGVGFGASFLVQLPVSASDTTRFESMAAAAQRRLPLAGLEGIDIPDLTGISVLAVDDDQESNSALKLLLEKAGAEIKLASSASEALNMLRVWIPSVLISDIGMPDEDGLSLIRKLRALPWARGGAIPALALTAYGRVEDKVQILSAGFQMHVTKPVDPIELVAIVASLAGRTTLPHQGDAPAHTPRSSGARG